MYSKSPEHQALARPDVTGELGLGQGCIDPTRSIENEESSLACPGGHQRDKRATHPVHGLGRIQHIPESVGERCERIDRPCRMKPSHIVTCLNIWWHLLTLCRHREWVEVVFHIWGDRERCLPSWKPPALGLLKHNSEYLSSLLCIWRNFR